MRSPWQAAALAGLTCCAIGLTVAIATDDLWLGASPLLLVAAIFVVRYRPLRVIILSLIFVALVVDNPQERPSMGLWKSVLYPPGALLYENLDSVLGYKALHFSLLDLLLLLLAAAVVFRRARGVAAEPLAVQAARPMTLFLILTLVSVLSLEAWGLLNGGDFKSSLWQLRELLWLPIIGLILISTLRGPQDQITIGLLVIVAATIKMLEGLYFFSIVAPRLKIHAPYATTHSDTVLFVTALMVGVSYWLVTSGRRARWLLLFTSAVTAVAIVVNGRRLAYVDVIACFALLYLVHPKSRVKRIATRVIVLAAPMLVIYIGVGFNSSSRVFAPARALSTLLFQEDRSSLTRDIENYNLLQTLKHNKLLGTGFGHEYEEVSKGDSIAQYFKLYRYIGHNSVLWLWMVGGVLGFAALWMTLVVGVFLAVRSFWRACSPVDRAAGLSAACTIVVFMLQAYGDMGFQSWTSTLLLALALAVASKLATAVGAWPVAPASNRRALQGAPTRAFTPLVQPS